MCRVVGILGICLAVSIYWGDLLAETPETKPDSTHAAEDHDHEHPTAQTAEEVRQRLHEPITLKLDKVPLEDALTEILGKRNLDFWYDEEHIKIARDTIEVTCNLRNVSIGAALKRILGQAQLGWVCEDTGIRITSAARQMSILFARIYDVRALLEKPVVEVAEPAKPHQQVQYICINPSLSGSGTSGSEKKLTPEETLIHTIFGATGGPPDSPWMEADGEGGTIHLIQTSHAKLLVIRHNEVTHAEIEHLLNELISHQQMGTEEGAAETPAEKTASRNIVRPRVRIVTKHSGR